MRTMYITRFAYIYENGIYEEPTMERWPEYFFSVRRLIEWTKNRAMDYKPEGTKRTTVSFLRDDSRLVVSFWDDKEIIVSVSVSVFKEVKINNEDISLFDDIVKVM